MKAQNNPNNIKKFLRFSDFFGSRQNGVSLSGQNGISKIVRLAKNHSKITPILFSIQDSFAPADEISEDCTSDQMLARLLQAKFDDEYCQVMGSTI